LEKVHAKNNSERAAQRYEERITELHCVIAELSRKLDKKHSNVIAEEEDDDEEADVDADAPFPEKDPDDAEPDIDADVSPPEDGSGTRKQHTSPLATFLGGRNEQLRCFLTL